MAKKDETPDVNETLIDVETTANIPDDVNETLIDVETTANIPDDIASIPDDVPMIVYRERYIDDQGTATTREHGPMPVADWPAYEKTHGF